MNNRGGASGLSLILLLAVALIVALLAARQLIAINKGGESAQESAQAVEQAREAVDQLNDRLGQYDTMMAP